MAKPKPPRIAPDELPKSPDEDLDQHLAKLYYRICNNIAELEKGKLNAQWVAFETLELFLPLLERGADHDLVKGAYPVKEWRNETVEVPTEILKILVGGWKAYTNSTKTMGEAFQFEKLNRQGASPMKRFAKSIDEARNIAARTLVVHMQIGDESPISRESAIAQVAEEFDVSESKVERAYREFGHELIDALLPISNPKLIAFKTSQTGDLD